jgi:integrase
VRTREERAMQRDRQQKGSVVRIGNYWCVRYADWVIENGERVRKLGLTLKLSAVLPEHRRLKNPPDYVDKLRHQFMDKVNAGRNAPERCSTLSKFIEDVWLPFIENRLSSSTVTVYKFYWNHILKPRCGAKLLRDFSTPSGQALLDDVARNNPEMRSGTLHKLKSILSAVFKLAIQQDYRPGPNPMRETSLPRAPEAQETHAYDLQTIRTILAHVPETAKVIVALAAYAGLSKSEIQGLVWEAYDGTELGVLSSVVNGKRGEPKTKARKATVPLIEPIRNLLEIHRLRMGNPATGVMFPTKNGTPLSLHNVLNDDIVPVLNRCEECGKGKAKHREAAHKFIRAASLPQWHGWHAFRRGLATNLHDLGVDDKTIQRILRHSDVSITQKAYIKTIPRQVTDAMAQLEEAIRKEGERPISVH